MKDEVQQAEALLEKQPKTAESVALRGEIEFRKGNFERADGFYKEALRMDAKNARAHFGLGKLAMSKVKGKQAVEEMKRAIELDPKEPIYRLYASEAWSIEKNYAEQRKELAMSDVKIKNIPVGTFNDPLVSQLADGILGTAALSDFIINVNYPANQLEISRKRSPVTAGTEVLPAWYFSNLLLIPLNANGKLGNFIVDTGAVTTVLSHNMAAQLGITRNTPGAKIDLGIAGVGGFEGIVLKVPNVTFKTARNTESFPQVVAIDLKQISKMIGTEVAGVAGFDFFSDYK